MFVEYIRYRLPGERCVEFERDYGFAGEPLLASPHCLGFELTRVPKTRPAVCCALSGLRPNGIREGSVGVPSSAPSSDTSNPSCRISRRCATTSRSGFRIGSSSE
jgi:hypothetical protein